MKLTATLLIEPDGTKWCLWCDWRGRVYCRYEVEV